MYIPHCPKCGESKVLLAPNQSMATQFPAFSLDSIICYCDHCTQKFPLVEVTWKVL